MTQCGRGGDAKRSLSSMHHLASQWGDGGQHPASPTPITARRINAAAACAPPSLLPSGECPLLLTKETSPSEPPLLVSLRLCWYLRCTHRHIVTLIPVTRDWLGGGFPVCTAARMEMQKHARILMLSFGRSWAWSVLNPVGGLHKSSVESSYGLSVLRINFGRTFCPSVSWYWRK
jgi:hypothetical protein